MACLLLLQKGQSDITQYHSPVGNWRQTQSRNQSKSNFAETMGNYLFAVCHICGGLFLHFNKSQCVLEFYTCAVSMHHPLVSQFLVHYRQSSAMKFSRLEATYQARRDRLPNLELTKSEIADQLWRSSFQSTWSTKVHFGIAFGRRFDRVSNPVSLLRSQSFVDIVGLVLLVVQQCWVNQTREAISEIRSRELHGPEMRRDVMSLEQFGVVRLLLALLGFHQLPAIRIDHQCLERVEFLNFFFWLWREHFCRSIFCLFCWAPGNIRMMWSWLPPQVLWPQLRPCFELCQRQSDEMLNWRDWGSESTKSPASENKSIDVCQCQWREWQQFVDSEGPIIVQQTLASKQNLCFLLPWDFCFLSLTCCWSGTRNWSWAWACGPWCKFPTRKPSTTDEKIRL